MSGPTGPGAAAAAGLQHRARRRAVASRVADRGCVARREFVNKTDDYSDDSPLNANENAEARTLRHAGLMTSSAIAIG
jgi:hypothetical protein